MNIIKNRGKNPWRRKKKLRTKMTGDKKWRCWCWTAWSELKLKGLSKKRNRMIIWGLQRHPFSVISQWRLYPLQQTACSKSNVKTNQKLAKTLSLNNTSQKSIKSWQTPTKLEHPASISDLSMLLCSQNQSLRPIWKRSLPLHSIQVTSRRRTSISWCDPRQKLKSASASRSFRKIRKNTRASTLRRRSWRRL